ncbi:hypothetical protein BC828DRAFT_379572 [Blastocladiella britannica]|nr:hypothetical protein BC828DRAFT_379572 [Blastocladiella britannica]
MPYREITVLADPSTPWNPLDYDAARNGGDGRGIHIFMILQSFIMLPLVLFILVLVWYRRKLVDTPANVLFVSLCAVHACYLVALLVLRFILVANAFIWTEPLCETFAIINCFGMTLHFSLVLLIAAERHLTFGMGIRIPRWGLPVGYGGALGFSGFVVYANSANGSWNIISSSGGYCFPSAIAESWVSLFLVVAMLATLVQIGGAYALMLWQIRKSAMRVSGPSESRLAQDPSRRQQRTAALERRVVMRGVWTAIGIAFTVIPFSCILIYMYITGQRCPDFADDAFLTIKHLTEVSDPIILLVLDIRFRSAAKELLTQWFGIQFEGVRDDSSTVASRDHSGTGGGDGAQYSQSQRFRSASRMAFVASGGIGGKS